MLVATTCAAVDEVVGAEAEVEDDEEQPPTTANAATRATTTTERPERTCGGGIRERILAQFERPPR